MKTQHIHGFGLHCEVCKNIPGAFTMPKHRTPKTPQPTKVKPTVFYDITKTVAGGRGLDYNTRQRGAGLIK